MPRYGASLPIEITVLRSGIPLNFPGRLVDLGTGGVGAIVSDELSPGEIVGVEWHLEADGPPVRARARVRYQNRLRSGIEFTLLPPEEQNWIAAWVERTPGSRVSGIELARDGRPAPAAPPVVEIPQLEEPAAESGKVALLLRWSVPVVLLAALATGLGWYVGARKAHEGNGVPARVAAATAAPRAIVPADIMQSMLVQRVMPDYPEEARQAGVEGRVLLHLTVDRDGRVAEAKVVDGPAPLQDSALRAVRQWRFEPFQNNGAPAEVETNMEVEFRLRP
jgi:protein TonB